MFQLQLFQHVAKFALASLYMKEPVLAFYSLTLYLVGSLMKSVQYDALLLQVTFDLVQDQSVIIVRFKFV